MDHELQIRYFDENSTKITKDEGNVQVPQTAEAK
eukprot:IDg6390t1